jgi:hypothetical protein
MAGQMDQQMDKHTDGQTNEVTTSLLDLIIVVEIKVAGNIQES